MALLLGAGLAGCGRQEGDDDPQVVRVPGDAPTISAAVEQVDEGGLVLVSPGRYREQVTITTEGVTLRGTDRNDVIIDGEGMRSAGVVGAADGVRVENLTVTNATLYGVLVTNRYDGGGREAPGSSTGDGDAAAGDPLERFRIDHVTATNNGLYGIYAFTARHGVIASSMASGSADSGIYVGQCRACDVLVTGNVAMRNAIGFENANASDSVTIVGNRFSDNRVGLTLTTNHQEDFVPQRANVVAGNAIVDNREPMSPAQATGGFGIGIGIGGGKDNELLANRISGNPLAGVLLTSVEDVAATGNQLRDNLFEGNGVDVANVATSAAPAMGNCVSGPPASLLPLELAEGCDGPNPAALDEELPSVPEPAGLSFLEVPLPPPQPSMPADDVVPPALPAAVEHPAVDDVAVPPADLLAERTR